MSLTIHPTQEANWWPLLQDQACGTQLIAGKTLLELQQQNADGISDAHQYDNAWITQADWEKLAAAAQPAVLKSAQGYTLAWTGDQNGEEITASEQSFLINYAWEFISLNEQIVSQLNANDFQGDVSPAAHIDGFVSVGKGSKILPGVVIEGNVVIGENCKIGPNCYLRGSTTIGNDCHIGQAVEIKNSIVGHGSSVGHLSYVGDSVIGNQVNFGAGTITSNLRHDGANHKSMIEGRLLDTGRRKFGAIIGDGTHTGILTAIYPGRKLGPNSSTRPNDTVERDLT
ncbi:hypothetical protein JO972_11195 [Verrucomicrobiaceae bacterium 5K15]|uniref:Mannose-1-phosphate guanyltransferase C-terminal domain-containing protein n=1 Tax=Oceaniferula flava TaxID=2800421 RepID=A0AAE2SC85_9BACT|nr:hypothetical protein [Oceaniferula flavus]MBK1855526.1 hypothetical protein [Oceaniferula flavus]MBM1136832.1 hypothetical protein [Oceaniferula flavus]